MTPGLRGNRKCPVRKGRQKRENLETDFANPKVPVPPIQNLVLARQPVGLSPWVSVPPSEKE